MCSSLSCPPYALGRGWRAFALTHAAFCVTDAGLLSSQLTGMLAGSQGSHVCIRIPHQPLCYFPQANSTMEVPVTLSPLPEQEGKESETPIHQHKPLHPHHHHHEASSEKATNLSGDREPAAHAHHHHGDRSQPHHEGKKQEEGSEH